MKKKINFKKWNVSTKCRDTLDTWNMNILWYIHTAMTRGYKIIIILILLRYESNLVI